MAIGTIQRVRVVGSKTVPRLVSADIAFGPLGTVTVNATDLEASKILGVFGGCYWGSTAAAAGLSGNGRTPLIMEVETSFVEGGVTSVKINSVDPNNQALEGSAGLQLTVTVLFECE